MCFFFFLKKKNMIYELEDCQYYIADYICLFN